MRASRNHSESHQSFPASLTIDGLLVVWVHKVPWVLNCILEVPDSMWTVPLTPHPFLGCLRLLLTFWKPVLFRTGMWEINGCLVSAQHKYQAFLWLWVLSAPLPLKRPKSICFRSTASDPSVSPENHCECNFRIPDLFTQTTDYEHLMSKAKYTHLSTATNSDCKRTSWWLRGKPLQGVQLHFSIPDSGTEIQAELRMQHKKSDSEPPLLPVVCRKGWWMQSKYCYYRCQPKTTYTFNKAS